MFDADVKKSIFFKKAMITDVIEKKNGVINPVLVCFQNGNLNAGQEKNMTVSLFLNGAGDTEVEISSFDGQIFKEVDFNKSKTKQYIVAHNKKTHKIKIMEVDSALLINSALIDSENANESKSSVKFSEDIQKLGKAFGSKRMQHKLQQRAKLNMDSSLINEEIKVAAKDIGTKPDEIVSNRAIEIESIIQMLPPCNRNASEFSDVYALSDIVNDEELEVLKAEMTNIGDNKMEDVYGFSEFFIHCCNEAKKSNENVQSKLAAILFTEILIKFLKTSSRDLGSKRANFCPFSSLIHSKIVKEFCVKTGTTITRPFLMRDKALCYIMAIILTCCNFQIDLRLLAAASAVHFIRLSRLAKAVGALPSSKDGGIFTLRLPLPPLPKSSIGKTKRK